MGLENGLAENGEPSSQKQFNNESMITDKHLLNTTIHRRKSRRKQQRENRTR